MQDEDRPPPAHFGTETRARRGQPDHGARRQAQRAELGEISAALRQLEAGGVRALILRARPGAAVWSAGHSLDELDSTGHDPLDWQDPLHLREHRPPHFRGQ